MNFKTTAVLLALLIVVGGYVLFTKDKGPSTQTQAPPPAHTVLDVPSSDVTAVTVAGPDSKTTVALEKQGANWRLTQPVKSAADSFSASSLVDDLTTNLKPTSTVPAAQATGTGLDQPQYTVTLHTTDGKDHKLALGNRLSGGDGVFARVDGSDTIDVVPTTVLDTLARPADDLRKKQLFDVTSSDVQQLTVTHKDGSKLALQKVAGSWKMVAPSPAPADTSAVDDLLATVINLSPVSFVDDRSDAVGLNRPAAVVSFSTAAPATRPTTAPSTGPAPTVVTIGGYDDVAKKNVFAALSDGTVVKVAATVLDSINKSPLDLRDKAVLDVDPAKVTKVVVATETAAATKPTVQPSSAKTVVLTRRPAKPVAMGPSTHPTTGPATAPASAWLADGNAADDAKVTSLLNDLHPLKADKFLPANGITHPARRVTVTLTAGSTTTVVHIDDPGHDLNPVGTADDLTFNLPTTVVTDLSAEFKK